MSAADVKVKDEGAVPVVMPRRSSLSLGTIVFRLIALAVIDTFALYFLYGLLYDGVYFLAVAVAFVTVMINVVFLREDLYPLRWIAPGLALMIIMSVYPILFTIYTAFTNYGDGHLLTQQQAIHQLEKVTYLPEGGATFSWTAFRSAEGEFALWLLGPDGVAFLARPGEAMASVAPGEAGVGPLDDAGIPQAMEGYRRLARAETVRFVSELSRLEFGEEPDTVRVRSLDAAIAMQQRYIYDPALDAMVDQQTGDVFRNVQGTFTNDAGQTLRPGFHVVVGWRNFERFFTSPTLRGPLIRVTLWTFMFAFLSVATTFAFGLFVAIVFDDPYLPGKKLIRSLLIIPYTIPAVITILIWRGLLNPNLGIISLTIQDIFGITIPFFAHPSWAKVGILLINLWLGYPYMMLICSGALQAIPSDIYAAAEVDGANTWQRFTRLTLPLLLITVGPLLIASFTFNLNNFNVIYLYNSGGPPIAGTATPAGHTDILVSYIYRLAFAGGRGADYGYAAAITIVLFIVMVAITWFNFRFTRMWEEMGENV
jgi:arabinogalactan oligomer / maltooligosaccharide transport system permease protein